jgi:hypothetical protein
MKKAVKKKSESAAQGSARVIFRTFTDLAEKVAAGRPLMRGARVGRDPAADRFVVVHAGSQIEFVLLLAGEQETARAEVECRRIDSSGASGSSAIARFAFDPKGVIVESSVPELMATRIDDKEGAWSVVASVMWSAQG